MDVRICDCDVSFERLFFVLSVYARSFESFEQRA